MGDKAVVNPLQALRERCGFRHQQMALALGLTTSEYTRSEAYGHRLPAQARAALVEIGIDPEDLAAQQTAWREAQGAALRKTMAGVLQETGLTGQAVVKVCDGCPEAPGECQRCDVRGGAEGRP